MEISDELNKQYEFFLRRGFSGRVGFGEKPAILVVDFVRGFTDLSGPRGMDLSAEMRQTLRILNVAREKGVPIIYTTVGWEAERTDNVVWLKKVRAARALVVGSEWGEVDPILERRPEEAVVLKGFASAFFGTDLLTRLVSHRVDTVITTGCTTSGCVRATAVDAIGYGFHSVVVADAVGDRAIPPHLANLYDLDAKYADVVTTEDVLAHMANRR